MNVSYTFNAFRDYVQAGLEFLRDNAIALNQGKFDELYYKVRQDSHVRYPSIITYILLNSGADPLSKVRTIYPEMYLGLDISTINIPNNTTKIGVRAFSSCTSLNNVTLPDSIRSIGSEAFEDCYSLAYIKIPDNVRTIADHTFYHCTSLTNIILPEGLDRIGDEAFLDCASLTEITLPNSLSYIGTAIFKYCNSLKHIYYNGTKEEFGDIEIRDYNKSWIRKVKFKK